jgi:hypothetical protein
LAKQDSRFVTLEFLTQAKKRLLYLIQRNWILIFKRCYTVEDIFNKTVIYWSSSLWIPRQTTRHFASSVIVEKYLQEYWEKQNFYAIYKFRNIYNRLRTITDIQL